MERGASGPYFAEKQILHFVQDDKLYFQDDNLYFCSGDVEFSY